MVDITLASGIGTIGAQTRKIAARTAIRAPAPRRYTIFRRKRVRQVIARVNGLRPLPRGNFACPMLLRADSLTLTLALRRRRGGPVVATVTSPVAYGRGHDSGASVCSPVHFTLRGGTPLALLSDGLARTVGRLTGWNIS